MKILFYSQGFGKPPFIYNQVELVAEEHEVLYVCEKWNKITSQKFKNVTELAYPSSGWYHWLRQRLEWRDLNLSFKDKSYAKSLKQVINAFDPHIIHCQFGWEALKLIDNYPTNKPIVISFRGYDASMKLQHKTYVKRLRNLLAREHIYCTFVCEHLRKNLNNVGITVRDSVILHSNTDVEFFQRKSFDIPRKPLVYVQNSSFREKKGHSCTLSAFALLKKKHPDLSFEVWFTGYLNEEDKKKYKGLVSGLDLEGEVQFVGEKTPDEIRMLYEQAHVAILHSITTKDGDQEGIPNALMEAMSMQMPIVSSIHAGIPELVEHNKHGLLVEETNIHNYAEALFEISKWTYQSQNRDRVVEHFSKAQHKATLLDYYRKIHQSHKSTIL